MEMSPRVCYLLTAILAANVVLMNNTVDRQNVKHLTYLFYLYPSRHAWIHFEHVGSGTRLGNPHTKMLISQTDAGINRMTLCSHGACFKTGSNSPSESLAA